MGLETATNEIERRTVLEGDVLPGADLSRRPDDRRYVVTAEDGVREAIMPGFPAGRHTADHFDPDALYGLLVHLVVRGRCLRGHGERQAGDETKRRDEAMSIHTISSLQVRVRLPDEAPPTRHDRVRHHSHSWQPLATREKRVNGLISAGEPRDTDTPVLEALMRG
jgi:hypothetical protein